MKKAVIAFVVLLALPAISWSLPTSYSAGPTWGTVIDAETKQPLSGVLVLALWDLEGGMETGQIATLEVAEAMTDEKGEFRISGWGPVPRPTRGVLDAYDPQLIIFKTGYVPERLLNDKFPPHGKRASLQAHDSAWNGKTITLKKYAGPLRPYSQRVGFIVGSLRNVLNGTDCSWKRIPKTVRVLEDESKRELAAGTLPSFTASSDNLMSRSACAPFDEFKRALTGSN